MLLPASRAGRASPTAGSCHGARRGHGLGARRPRRWGFTARMSIEYRRPVPVGARIRGEGRCRARRRLLTSGAARRPRHGRRFATADGVYVAAPEARREELKARYGFRLVRAGPRTRDATAAPVATGRGRGGAPTDRGADDGATGAVTARCRPPAGDAGPRRAFVADASAAARALGGPSPSRSTTRRVRRRARAGLASLADPAYLAGQRLVAPGIGPTPRRADAAPRRGPSPASVGRARRAPARAARGRRGRSRVTTPRAPLDGDPILGWILAADPERGWQVIRRIGRDADDWITVDTLAGVRRRHPARAVPLGGAGAARLQPARWERRLVGSTVATHPPRRPRLGRPPRWSCAAWPSSSS